MHIYYVKKHKFNYITVKISSVKNSVLMNIKEDIHKRIREILKRKGNTPPLCTA